MELALLPQELQALFTCCSVFRGGFRLEALRAVWRDDAVLNLLPKLLEQSLLQSVPGASSRWRMLEPLRELAAQKLPAILTSMCGDGGTLSITFTSLRDC